MRRPEEGSYNQESLLATSLNSFLEITDRVILCRDRKPDPLNGELVRRKVFPLTRRNPRPAGSNTWRPTWGSTEKFVGLIEKNPAESQPLVVLDPLRETCSRGGTFARASIGLYDLQARWIVTTDEVRGFIYKLVGG